MKRIYLVKYIKVTSVLSNGKGMKNACMRAKHRRVNFYRDREMRLRDVQLKNALHVHDGAKMNRENGARRQKQGAFSRDEN